MMKKGTKKGLVAATAIVLLVTLWNILTTSDNSSIPSYVPTRIIDIMKDLTSTSYTKGSDVSPSMKIEVQTFSDAAPGDIMCIGAEKGQSEDLFCLDRNATLSNYKNPCWKDDKAKTRCLPYFHLIGCGKSGTSDLFYRIQQHPDVTGCTCDIGKESMYWGWERYGYSGKVRSKKMRSFLNYTHQFDVAARVIDKKATDGYHHVIVGDGSPMDFWDFRGWTLIPQNKGLSKPRVLTPHLMRHMYGDKKMILIMRNPVDRLYSDYYFLRYGDSPELFHRDAVKSVTMMKNCLQNSSIAGCFYSEDMYRILPTRIHIGCYSVFLKEWLSVFPIHNFLFIRTEDYEVDIKNTLSNVYNFLQLRPLEAANLDRVVNLQRRHVTDVKIGARPMFQSTRDLLTSFYQKYNNELASTLNDERFLWRT